jgi:hypothetical protein
MFLRRDRLRAQRRPRPLHESPRHGLRLLHRGRLKRLAEVEKKLREKSDFVTRQ